MEPTGRANARPMINSAQSGFIAVPNFASPGRTCKQHSHGRRIGRRPFWIPAVAIQRPVFLETDRGLRHSSCAGSLQPPSFKDDIVPISEEVSMRNLALAILTIATVSAAPSLAPRPMIQNIRSACKFTRAIRTITSSAPIPHCHSAECQHRAAPAQCVINPYYAGASPGRRDRRQRRAY